MSRRIVATFALPPGTAVQKVSAAARRAVVARLQRRADRTKPSFALDVVPPQLDRRILGLPLALLGRSARTIRSLADLYAQHRFDLLGSGWVHVKYGMTCRGTEGLRFDAQPAVSPDSAGRWLEHIVSPPNHAEACRIWGLVQHPYQPIDWQLDYKSGYRWAASQWSGDIAFGAVAGADIKVPWELARMQHLIVLAYAHALTAAEGRGGEDSTYSRELRSQLLDFIASNPPRFGVNWVCTMDVAIRAANILVSLDVCRSAGAQFDDEFLAVVGRSVLEHGRHILANLEWSPEFRGNHYLSNIAGLAFVAAYLPAIRETDAWLRFAADELIEEVHTQFAADGANLEGSTCYHRLSSEIVVHTTALLLGLPSGRWSEIPASQLRLLPGFYRRRVRRIASRSNETGASALFPEWYGSLLRKMAEFTTSVTKQDGRVIQIGDNDNGRFLKLDPVFREESAAHVTASYANLSGYQPRADESTYWYEEHLDHRHLVAAVDAVTRPAAAPDALHSAWEATVLRVLAHGSTLPYSSRTEGLASHTGPRAAVGDDAEWNALVTLIARTHAPFRRTYRFASAVGGLRDDLKLLAYPEFGLYIMRSARLFLSIRCGPVGQRGIGGHAHCDQLAIELEIDGVSRAVDPGSYLYTPLPEMRNRYRSVRSHFAPQIAGVEPAMLHVHPFKLSAAAEGRCRYFGHAGFGGTLQGAGWLVHCIVGLGDDHVIVHHLSAGRALAGPPSDEGGSPATGWPVTFSPGYGIRLTHALRYPRIPEEEQAR